MAGPNVFYLFERKNVWKTFSERKIGLGIPKVEKLNRCLTCELSFDSSPVCFYNYANVFMHNRLVEIKWNLNNRSRFKF